MIALDKLVKKYDDNSILNDICCEFPKGKITAIVGENGSGKSTLLSIIGRFLSATDGNVFIGDTLASQFERNEYARTVSTLRQSQQIQAKIRVEEFVKLARFPHSKGKLTQKDHEIVAHVLRIMECENFKERYLNTLSGGQLQRVYIAAIFAQDTDIILLDEPLNNLDLKHSHHLMKLIKEFARLHGKTIVVIMHDINMVYQYADYALALKNGTIVHCGDVSSFKSEEVLEQIYDLKFQLIHQEPQCYAIIKEGL